MKEKQNTLYFYVDKTLKGADTDIMNKMKSYSGALVKQARERKSLTQEKLAELLQEHLGRDIVPAQVKGWEGGIKPNADYLFAIAQILGQSIEYFYADNSPQKAS